MSLALLTGCGQEAVQESTEHTYAYAETNELSTSEKEFMLDLQQDYVGIYEILLEIQPYYDAFWNDSNFVYGDGYDRRTLHQLHSELQVRLEEWELHLSTTERTKEIEGYMNEYVSELLLYTDTMYDVLVFAPEMLGKAQKHMQQALIINKDLMRELDELGVKNE